MDYMDGIFPASDAIESMANVSFFPEQKPTTPHSSSLFTSL